jgi:hypothetical protein
MDSLNLQPSAKQTEHFDFGSSAHDLPVGDKKRNIRNEVSNKFDPEKVIDAYEEARGFKKRKVDEPQDFVFKSTVLDPEQQRDQDLLHELLNNKKYIINHWKDTWTAQGNFRVFIIYGTKKEKEE